MAGGDRRQSEHLRPERNLVHAAERHGQPKPGGGAWRQARRHPAPGGHVDAAPAGQPGNLPRSGLPPPGRQPGQPAADRQRRAGAGHADRLQQRAHAGGDARRRPGVPERQGADGDAPGDLLPRRSVLGNGRVLRLPDGQAADDAPAEPQDAPRRPGQPAAAGRARHRTVPGAQDPAPGALRAGRSALPELRRDAPGPAGAGQPPGWRRRDARGALGGGAQKRSAPGAAKPVAGLHRAGRGAVSAAGDRAGRRRHAGRGFHAPARP